ncbi:MAG: hypothetical protein DU480_13685 [Nitrosomonas sp.]
MRYQINSLKFIHPDFDNLGFAKTGIQALETGKLAIASDRDAIRQSILLLISTVPGERVMRPKYGCNLQQLAFMPNDATTHGLAIHFIRVALEQWEPRISIVNLDANTSADSQDSMNISIHYKIKTLPHIEQLIIAYHLGS